MTASSWKLPCIEELANNPMVLKAKTHMCQFGMIAVDEDGEGLVKKPTTMMTNSVASQRAGQTVYAGDPQTCAAHERQGARRSHKP